MASGIDGVGEAFTGGMLARAVEPEAGEAGTHAPPRNCLNCGAELVGAYCHSCGQKGHVHRTLGAFWHELVHGVFHFEGKIWRTLPLLAWRPGELTRRYIDGERARFVSPIALFLFSVFLMFAVFSLVGGPFAADPGAAVEDPVEARAEAERDFREEQAETRAELAQLRERRQRRVQAGRPTTNVDREIAEEEARLAVEERVFRQTLDLIAGAQSGQAGSAPQSGNREAPFTGNPTGVDLIDNSLRKARENPALVAYKLQTNAYKFSWALIPISVPFLWLLFLHRRRYRRFKAYDHTIFVTYSIAFMSLGLIALSLLRPLGLGETLTGLAISFVPPIHMYRQLRGAYSLSRWSALWRTFTLLMFAFVAASLFLSLLIALG